MKDPNRPIAYWLLSGCFLIFCMVVIGGITRLTGSGLSITEWKPIMGAVPPMNEADWHVAFEKYQQIPQFQKVNAHFSLSDFKQIFWWEWIHRQLGRLIGLVFIIPFIYFLAKKKLDRSTLKKVIFLFLLGALQGFFGWFMVKSGLTERTSVSHIRLAIHLITAFITFAFSLYYALELLQPAERANPDRKHNQLIILLFAILIIQVIYGAFVAGMHAGKIHTTFPLMSGSVIPPGMNYLQPGWTNLFNNQVTVQFIHRLFAFVIVFITGLIYFRARKIHVTPLHQKGINMLVAAVLIQFTLGVFTLLTAVNITLASLHQVGAFFLFSTGVYLLYHRN
jgi:heme a synthase